MGTGHVKRANALQRGFSQLDTPVHLHISAGSSRFLHILHPEISSWREGAERINAVIVDHKLEPLPPSLSDLAPLFIQLCRAASPRELPSFLRTKTIRVSIEDCAENRERGLPYEGCLIDADPGDVLSPERARERLSSVVGAELGGTLGLTHVNTYEPEAALGFLRKASATLAGRADTIVVSSGHREVLSKLQEESPSPAGSRLITTCLHPIYPYYPAFQFAFVPMGYNTYCEAKLFFTGQCTYEPVSFWSGRQRFRDQVRRNEEMPVVGRIGNRQIARKILEFVLRKGHASR
jgi:hypothetical protein